jgi:hypothetical protein
MLFKKALDTALARFVWFLYFLHNIIFVVYKNVSEIDPRRFIVAFTEMPVA